MCDNETLVREESHHIKLCANLYCYFLNQEMVDTTLVLKDGKIKAHAIVLSSGSRYFWNILSTNEAKHEESIILESTSKKIMEYLLEFLYIGQVDVPDSDLEEVLDASKLYDVRGIIRSMRKSNSTHQILEETETDDDDDGNVELSPIPSTSPRYSRSIVNTSSSTSSEEKETDDGNVELSPIPSTSPRYSRSIVNISSSTSSEEKETDDGYVELSPIPSTSTRYSRSIVNISSSTSSEEKETDDGNVELSPIPSTSPRYSRSIVNISSSTSNNNNNNNNIYSQKIQI